MPEIANVNWDYDLTHGVTADKHGPRQSTTFSMTHAVVGCSGEMDGPIRPTSGFRLEYELDFYGSDHDATSVVTDIFPISIRVSDTEYGWGVVYRVKRKNGSATADVFLDLWTSLGGTATTFDVKGEKVMDAVSSTAYMDVVAWGRLVYIFVEGRAPARFYVSDNSGTAQVNKLGVSSAPYPGPGPKILLSRSDTTDPEDFAGTGFPSGGSAIANVQVRGNEIDVWSTDPPTIDESVDLPRGEYSIAIRLADTRTGLVSRISEIGSISLEDFESDETKKVNVSILYDSGKWDRAYIYRSVNTEESGIPREVNTLYLEAVIDLEEYDVTVGSVPGGLSNPARAVYYLTLEDTPLFFKEVYVESDIFDEVMPKAGAGVWYGGVMLTSSISGDDGASPTDPNAGDLIRGVGEIRYSSIFEISPELFAPYNYHLSKTPEDSPITFRPIYPNCLGWSPSRIFHFRRDASSIGVTEMHEGFGIVSNKAVAVVGSNAYFVTSKGVKAVSTDGTLEDVRAFDKIITDEWRTQLSGVSASFDSEASALFFLNPTAERCAVLFFNASRAAEIHDTNFAQVASGYWPSNPNDFSSDLRMRAIFVQNAPKNNDTDAITGWKPRIFVYDYDRTKVIADSASNDGSPRLTTLEPTGNLILPVGTAFTTGADITLNSTGLNVPSTGAKWEACKIYVTQAANSALIGKSATIRTYSVPFANTVIVNLVSAEASVLHGLAVGDRVAVSPVAFKWEGRPVDVRDPEGLGSLGINFFRIKQINQVSAAFTDVNGPPTGTTDAAYSGQVFSGDADEPSESVFPKNTSSEKISSVIPSEPRSGATFGRTTTDGAYGRMGAVLSPGVRVLCPDLDFTLLAVRAAGTITGVDRSARS